MAEAPSAPPLELLITAGEWDDDGQGDSLVDSICSVLQTAEAGAMAHLPKDIVRQIIGALRQSRLKPLEDALREAICSLDLSQTTNVLIYANPALIAGGKMVQYMEQALGERSTGVHVTLVPSVKAHMVRWAEGGTQHQFLIEKAASISTTRVGVSLPPTTVLADLDPNSFQHIVALAPQLLDRPSPAPDLARLLVKGGQISYIGVIGGTTFPRFDEAALYFPDQVDEETAAALALLKQKTQETRDNNRKLVAQLHNEGLAKFQFSLNSGTVPLGLAMQQMLVQLLVRTKTITHDQASKVNHVLSIMFALFPNPVKSIDVLVARAIKM